MIQNVAEIVAAFVKRNQVPSTELPALIQQVSQSLSGLGKAPVAAPVLTPAVPIRRSLAAETITCLDCGQTSKTLKRHLTSAHGLTPDQYRSRWNLPTTYPMVAPGYSAKRSALAKSLGLGTKPRTRRRK
jgi:predicted transcriptional regulator